ncbi:MAG TPA: indolepyruvate oxidoreductase subunit beta [Bacteroidales bacterium]|nr:indolepyruvate oxidoreductase subunit beta [Bacteroidales bacterium]
MKKDIILSGVGGQGILSIASVIDLAAIKSGLNVKQSEVHGMSQRGGAVQSHLRISDGIIYSDIISLGTADMIVSVEPLEALRYLSFLKQDGRIITSVNFYKNIENYPDETELIDELNRLNCLMIDAEKVAREVGNVKTSNMVVLGAAMPFLDLPQQNIEFAEIFKNKGQNIIDVNIMALRKGIELINL